MQPSMVEFWLNVLRHLLPKKAISFFGSKMNTETIPEKHWLFRYQKQSNGYDFIDYEIKNVAPVYVESW
jgi:hypothetical protein